MSKNFNIAATEITDLIRVSSAAIFYEFENRFQVETWIFSSDPNHRSRQFIHGSCHEDDVRELVDLGHYARTFHRRIALKLMKIRGDIKI